MIGSGARKEVGEMQATEKQENNKGRGRPEGCSEPQLSKYHLSRVTSPGGFHSLARREDAKLTLGESIRDSRNLEVLSKPEGLSTLFFL